MFRLSDIAQPESGKESRPYYWGPRASGGMPPAHLGMIFTHGGIPSIMQSVFDPPVPSRQFQYECGIGQAYRQTRHPVLPWDMVDKSISPLQTSLRLFFVSGQSGQARAGDARRVAHDEIADAIG